MLELRRKWHFSHFVIIAEPFNLTFFKIHTHSYHRFIFQSEFSCKVEILSTIIYKTPKSQTYKMLAVDVSVMFEIAIAKS